MTILYLIGGLILAVIALMWGAEKQGKTEAKKDQAEDNVEAMKEYERIDSKPPVDNPFSHMKGKT